MWIVARRSLSRTVVALGLSHRRDHTYQYSKRPVIRLILIEECLPAQFRYLRDARYRPLAHPAIGLSRTFYFH